MTNSQDPTDAIRRKAMDFFGVTTGTSCNQSAFKVGKGTFLFIGLGPKGIGFKARFKLKTSMAEALELAEQNPERFEIGSTGWVTSRFTSEDPLPSQIWERWLSESYEITRGSAE